MKALQGVEGQVEWAERAAPACGEGQVRIRVAAAGLNRLGLDGAIRERLSLDDFLPAPGQGALALQTRTDDRGAAWVAALDDPATALAVAAERGAMTALEGSCRTAIGAHAEIAAGRLRLTTEMLAPNGSVRWRRVGEISDIDSGDVLDQGRALGLRLGAEVRDAAGDQRVEP